MDRYDVFLCYSSVDEDVVEGFAKRLRGAGLRVFFAPRDIVPGDEWQKRLEQALAGSRTYAVFLGPRGLSPWQSKEVAVALDQKVAEEPKRVIPLLLPGSNPEDLPQFLSQRMWVDFRPDFPARRPWDRLLLGIRGTLPGPRRRRMRKPSPRLSRSRTASGPPPPPWASEFGQDHFGQFAAIKVGEAIQRLRWIPPGTFQMGSPESEEGRYSHEGPRHEVTLTLGFWLGDTPCTQAFWQAVMGENPSLFEGPDRPVEQVSWEDCQSFFDRLGDAVPGFTGQLPTEAQWEYACRAGTTGATWLGDLEILGDGTAQILDSIAWYFGTCRLKTHTVKGKKPNPWGLYDMLGNVREWCLDEQDHGKGYPGGARRDPVLKDGTKRVIRGGSWCSHARDVRAAYRLWGVPGSRFHTLGFRLSRGPKQGQAR